MEKKNESRLKLREEKESEKYATINLRKLKDNKQIQAQTNFTMQINLVYKIAK